MKRKLYNKSRGYFFLFVNHCPLSVLILHLWAPADLLQDQKLEFLATYLRWLATTKSSSIPLPMKLCFVSILIPFCKFPSPKLPIQTLCCCSAHVALATLTPNNALKEDTSSAAGVAQSPPSYIPHWKASVSRSLSFMHLKSGDQKPPVQQFLIPFLTQGAQEHQDPLSHGMRVD